MQTFLFSAQDLRGGGRQGGSQFQFVLIAPDGRARCGTGRCCWRTEAAATRPGIARRRLRPGSRRPAGERGDRPRCRRAAWRAGHRYRQRAEQCLCAAADLHHLHAAQPVQGGAGDRSAAADRSVAAGPAVRAGVRPASRCRCPRWRISRAAPHRWRCAPGPVPRRDAQLQPAAGRGAGHRGAGGGAGGARSAHAGRRAHRIRRQRALAAAIGAVATLADRRRVRWRSTSCWACCTKACCTR